MSSASSSSCSSCIQNSKASEDSDIFNMLTSLGPKTFSKSIRELAQEKKFYKSYGVTDKDVLTTDLAESYILELIKEKSEKDRSILSLTGSITTSPNIKRLDINSVANLLAGTYRKVLEETPDVNGFYTVWNASSPQSAQSHQNWLYYDVKEDKIIRFEPNGLNLDKNHGHFQMKEFMDILSGNMRCSWEYSTNIAINMFSGCRATSTILASMYIKGISFDELYKFAVSEDYKVDINIIKPFTYILQKEIEACNLQKVVIKRQTRGNDTIPSIVIGNT